MKIMWLVVEENWRAQCKWLSISEAMHYSNIDLTEVQSCVEPVV